LLEGQPLGPRERHCLGDRLDDAGAHDLVGGLRRLATAGGAKMGDRAAHGLEHRPGTLEGLAGAAGHDGERSLPRPFHPATHRTIEELHALLAVSAETVEQSITRLPEASPGASARTTSSTSLSAETQRTTASTPLASSAGVAGAATPSSPASACAFSRVRFQ